MATASRKILGQMPPAKIEAYLRQIGDDEAADRLFPSGGSGQGFSFSWGGEVWGLNGVNIGFIPPAPEGEDSIQDATAIKPDLALQGAQLKIVLDQFWVQRYPGMGKHRILCEFTGKNQTTTAAEELRFAMKLEARDESAAAVNGAPIFLGVAVGKNGIAFEGRTINVASSTDDELLAALESDVVKQGLSLLTTVQPALRPFVGLAGSLVGAILRRSQNKQVYDFKLGLDFAVSQTSAKLRLGSFVVVQSDMKNWSWDGVAWDAKRQLVVDRATRIPIAFNYLIFRVSSYDD